MKKRTRADEDEEKLELIEDSNIKSRTSADTAPQTTLSSSEDSSSDGTTSTSDDDDNEFHMSEDDDVDTMILARLRIRLNKWVVIMVMGRE